MSEIQLPLVLFSLVQTCINIPSFMVRIISILAITLRVRKVTGHKEIKPVELMQNEPWQPILQICIMILEEYQIEKYINFPLSTFYIF